MGKNFNKITSTVLITSYLLLVTASIASAALVPCGTSPAGGIGPVKECTICDLFVGVKNIVDFLVEIAWLIGVIILIYGGVMLLTSGGSEEKLKKGKTALWSAVWGLLIVFAAWLIIDTIIKWLGAGGQGVIQGWGPWNKIPGC